MLVLPDLESCPIACPTRHMSEWTRMGRFDSSSPIAQAYAPAPIAPTGARQLAANRRTPVNRGLSIRVSVCCIM
jgi:hypothetical protein